MKKIITIILILFTTSCIAQVDSSKLLITLGVKVKNVAYMGYLLSLQNTLADQPLRDSLIKYTGSGNLPDSISTTQLKAGVILKWFLATMEEQSGTAYSTFNELATANVATAGLISQLAAKKAIVNSEQGVSIWLYNNLILWYNRKQAVISEKMMNGRNWLLNPLNFN